MSSSARPNPEIRRLDSLIADGRIAEAEAVARTLLRRERTHVQAAVGLARCAFARDDLAEALRWAERAARFAPNDVALKAFFAALLIAAGRFAEVPPVLEASADRAATPVAAIALGQALARLGAADRLATLVAGQLRRFPAGAAPLLGALADHAVLSGAAAGWAAADEGLRIVGALRPAGGAIRLAAGPETLLSIGLDAFVQRYGRPDEGAGLVRFSLPLAAALEGRSLTVALDGTDLLGSPLRPVRHATVEGCAVLDGSRLSGWAWSPGDPPRQVDVRVTDPSGRCVALTTDRPVDDAGSFGVEDGDYGFVLDLDAAGDGLQPGLLHVTAGPGDVPLAGSPLPWPGPGRAARRPAPVGSRPARPLPAALPRADAVVDVVDVVVPVYRGRAESMACLRSVLAAAESLGAGAGGGGPGCELIVIDDASPEPDLVRDLEALAAEGRITLLRNGRNLGFPATVNRGLRLHPDRDVVLLNADTLVCGDWLARLRAAAYSSHDVGTVTPLSNDAAILSYPSGREPVPVPSPERTAALDRLAGAVNAGVRVELPTAVGFCAYIRRACLEETGPFEEHLFGRGYGEENDFCLRARRLGWRHLAAADVFVAHVGGRSFGRQKTILAARNSRLLESLHPGYHALVDAFIADDPLLAARRRLDLARWAEEPPRPSIALVTLAGRGGVARFVAEHTEALRAEGWRVLRIAPEVEGKEEVDDGEDDDEDEDAGGSGRRRAAAAPAERRCRIEVDGRPDLRDLVFRTRAEFAELAAVLQRAGVAAVEIHHTLGHDPILLDLPARLGVPYDLVVHDYGLICPRVNLVDGDGRYCGEPDLAACERCTADPADRADPELTAGMLRRRTRALAAGARRVTAPTRDVAERLLRHIAPRAVAVRPWEDVAPPPRPAAGAPRTREGRWRVCCIGAMGVQKGYDLLLACARDAAARDLPLEFVLVGFSEKDPPLFETGRAFVTGRFAEEEAVDLVRRQGAHLAFLPSISPETWCYALSTAWRAGLEVAAFDLGALAERIRAHRGHLLPPSLGAAAVNDALLGILDASTLHGVAIGRSDSFRSTTAPLPATDPDGTDRPRPTSPYHGVSSMFGSAAPTEAAQPTQIKATAQSLPLAPGFYSLVVTSGGGAAAAGELPLPCVQLATAPGGAAGTAVEMMGTVPGNWLTKPGDAIIVKVTGGNATVLLTSYKHADQPNATLSLQVARIDDAPVAGAGPAPAASPLRAAPQAAPQPQPVPVQPVPAPRTEIQAHVQRQGDMRFADNGWAGCVGQRLWIEAFSITPVEGLGAEDIEYKGLTANGWETPWMTGGNTCGSRGLGTPLIGFSIRLRGAAAERFDCVYEGAFVSGQRSAGGQNGSPCRSDAIGDPLEGILLRIVAKPSVQPRPF